MPLFILNIAGVVYAFFKTYWKIIAVLLAIVIIAAMFIRLFRHEPKLDEKQIRAAQQAIAENDRKKMTEILVESDLKEKQIDANLANADRDKLKSLQEARDARATQTNEQLAAELERRAKQ